MTLQLKSDESATAAVETRYFTGTIPYEILLQIIELVDLHTLLKCQSLNGTTYQLISLFSDQIVNSVASRQSYYKNCLFTRGRPDRLTIAYLRHVHIADGFCSMICRRRFGLEVGRASK